MVHDDRNQNDDRTRTHRALSSGTAVNNYRIIEKIGAGGMGEVYLAEDTRLNRRVALKFLPSHMADDHDARARFTREAQAVAKLDHPNIVTIHEVDEFEGRPYFAMQYIKGKTLHHYCHREPLPVNESVRLVADLCEGLARAHTEGVTHRDIKTTNILVDTDMRPKLLDFGLAAVRGSEMITQTGSTLGTIAYMSPEQAQGMAVDHRSDLFSLGIVLYELIAGTTPFRRSNDAATLHAIVHDSPDELTSSQGEVSPQLRSVVARCLAKKPGERYQSADELTADLRSLVESTSSGSSQPATAVSDARPSIAVLPFANMSADPENEYFSDGLTEELLNVLAKNPQLKVTGRTSSFAFKNKQEDLRGIGQKLGVGTLLEGSVRKAGNRVRITAQLVSTADGFHLWSETYDRVLDDIFAVQDDIATAVSKALDVRLLGKKVKKQTDNPESYALTLRAHQSEMSMTQSSVAMATDLYKKAIDLDSQNARAWAGLARCYIVSAAYGYGNTERYYELTKDALEKAITLDDTLPESYEVKSWLQAAFEFDFPGARKAARRALELAPNNYRAISSLSMGEAIFGRFEEALNLSSQSIDLEPLDPQMHLQHTRILIYAGRLDEAREAVLRALKLSPDLTTASSQLMWVELLHGNLDEALEVARREKIAGYRHYSLSIVYYALGKITEADKALAALLAEGDQWAHQFASVYAWRNDNDLAFEWLEKAYALKDAGLPLTRVHPVFKNLHSDPRWPVFLRKVGLAEY